MQAGLRMVDEGEGVEVGHVIFEWSPEGNFIISTQADSEGYLGVSCYGVDRLGSKHVTGALVEF
jgi:hypothetical protein